MNTTPTPQTTTFHAPDIHCGNCAASIKNALGKTPGVASVSVDVSAQTVTVTHSVPSSEVAAVLDDLGFTPDPASV